MPTKKQQITLFILLLLLLTACSDNNTPTPTSTTNDTTNTTNNPQATQTLTAQPATANATPPPVTLNPSHGATIGYTYEAFLSPQQEPAEESDTPALAPEVFLSTAPSVDRNSRPSLGHGLIRVTNDLSTAYIDLQIENVNPQDIVMFHIHCGRPDILGPILVDFALTEDLQAQFTDGYFSATVTHEDITLTSANGHGIVGAFTAGCPIIAGVPGDVKTIAGLNFIAQKGELYFNLHTAGQTFYGEMRGQLYPVPNTP
ncbi:MAG TPA: CHRD domain-containing protein [Anaerolineae bacterium]|nr:CHRD domain-containing protein [Anaerolineae bacterium]